MEVCNEKKEKMVRSSSEFSDLYKQYCSTNQLIAGGCSVCVKVPMITTSEVNSFRIIGMYSNK